jgi:hypothetical protein
LSLERHLSATSRDTAYPFVSVAADVLRSVRVPSLALWPAKPKCSGVRRGQGTEYCGNQEHHEYELYLAIVEWLHKIMLDEFYCIAFRRKVYDTIVALQTDLDAWLDQQ